MLLENVEIPERVVTFVSQDAQIVLGLVESLSEGLRGRNLQSGRTAAMVTWENCLKASATVTEGSDTRLWLVRLGQVEARVRDTVP